MSLPTDTRPERQIDRPLGMDRPKKQVGEQQAFRLPLAVLLVMLPVLAGSVWTALQRDALRDPPAVETDLAAAPDEPPAPEVEPAEQAAVSRTPSPTSPRIDTLSERVDDGTGPKIIQVKPQADSLPDLPDGANPAEVAGGGIVIRDASSLSAPMQLSAQPKNGLVEQSPNGPLPRIGPDGERPFDAYKRPAARIDGPAIALVLGGLGLSQTGTQHAIAKLPGEITLAFAPGGNSLTRWQQAARKGGHELLLQLPMEPFGYPNTDPGPGTLLADADTAETIALAHKAMGRITNYAGVMNYMGGRFLTENGAIAPLMAEIAGRGLMFVDDGTTPGSQARRLAAERNAPFVMAGEPIDTIRQKEAIRASLARLEEQARNGQPVIATASAFQMTVDEIAAWIDDAKGRGIRFVPVSALATDSR